MHEQTVKCPKCGFEIPLTEAFTRQIEDRVRAGYDETARQRQAEHEKTLREKEKQFVAALAAERIRVEAQVRQRASEAVAIEMEDLRARIAERDRQVEAAWEQELALRKRQRELEELQKSAELEAARKLDQERKAIWDQALAKTTEDSQLKLREKELQLDQMRAQIEELKKKAEQGPQQRQGEALELALEAALRAEFRLDEIEPVKKGQKGGDILHHVKTGIGGSAGAILWELKRTKMWATGWIAKLKDDQRDAKADIAVIVTEVLPAGVTGIGNLDGVWVSDFPSAMGLAMVLRHNLVALADARSALVGQQSKMELLYGYLSGTQFRQRVEGIVESFRAMKTDLDAERRAMEKHWAKREKQIEIVVKNTAGMYGDLQGIIGNALPAVQTLELPAGDAG